jgi:hypothetical protein
MPMMTTIINEAGQAAMSKLQTRDQVAKDREQHRQAAGVAWKELIDVGQLAGG